MRIFLVAIIITALALPALAAPKATHTETMRLIEALDRAEADLMGWARAYCPLVKKIEMMDAAEKASIKAIVDGMDDDSWTAQADKLGRIKQAQQWVQNNLGWGGCPQ